MIGLEYIFFCLAFLELLWGAAICNMELPDEIPRMVKAYSSGSLFNRDFFLSQKKAGFGETVLTEVLLEGAVKGGVEFSAKIALAVRHLRRQILGSDVLVIVLT